jgi:hypothetical protein
MSLSLALREKKNVSFVPQTKYMEGNGGGGRVTARVGKC